MHRVIAHDIRQTIIIKDGFTNVFRVVGSKQAFLCGQNAFPVLKPCRILCRHTGTNTDTTPIEEQNNNNNNNNNTSPIEEQMDKMMNDTTAPTTTDGTQMPGSTTQAVVSNLPSTLQENNNGSTPSATADDADDADDDDDATVQTSNSNSTKQAWTSYNIKLLLTSKQDTSDSALQHAMLMILETINREMGANVIFFDGVNQQVTDFQFQPATTF
jgi:hypothetical protein